MRTYEFAPIEIIHGDNLYAELSGDNEDLFDRLHYLDFSEAKNEIHFIIRDGDKIIGIAGIEKNPYDSTEYWVKHYSVDPEYRNLKVGTRLVDEVFRFANKHGMSLKRSSPSEMGKRYLSKPIDRAKERYQSVKVSEEVISEYIDINQEKYLRRQRQDRTNTIEDVDEWVQFLEEHDPSPRNKYVNWMITRYLRGDIKRLEDIPARITPALNVYQKLQNKKKLKPEHKDINRIQDLETVVASYQEQDVSSRKEHKKSVEQELYKSGEAELIHNSEDYKIVIPHSHKASCYFGRNTKWCTTARDDSKFHDEYSKEGPLHVILHKPSNTRWQLHFESGQFTDEKDNEIDLEKFVAKHPKVWELLYDYEYIEDLIENGTPEAIRFVLNPSEELQMAVVEDDPDYLAYIHNPTEDVQLEAIESYIYAFQYIKNPTERIQAALMKIEPTMIGMIDNPTEKVQMIAVNKDPELIKWIKNPTDKVKAIAKRLLQD